MKTPKTYRFSPATIRRLECLKQLETYEDYTETDLVEAAIDLLYASANTVAVKYDQDALKKAIEKIKAGD